MSKFTPQTGSFSYVFNFTPETGEARWGLNLGYYNHQYAGFSESGFKQKIQNANGSLELNDEYLFMSNPENGYIDVYKNSLISDELQAIDQYDKINRLAQFDTSGISGLGYSLSSKSNMLVAGDPYATINGKTGVGGVCVFNEFDDDFIGATGTGNWGGSFSITGSQESGNYGYSIATALYPSRNLIAVGAIGENSGSGSVHIYDDNGLTFIKTINPTGNNINNFGKSLAFAKSENIQYLAIGSEQNGTGRIDITKESAKDLKDFSINQTFTSDNPSSGDMFGYSLDSDSDNFFVGAPNYQNSGIVYNYQLNHESGTFYKSQELTGSGGEFGKNISFDGQNGVVTSSEGLGKAYIYKKNNDWQQIDSIEGTGNGLIFGGDTSGSFNVKINDTSLVIGERNSSNTISDNYYYSTGQSIIATSTSFSLSGENGKLHDNDGNFIYGYPYNQQTLVSGNVFTGYHNIFVNNHLCVSHATRNTGIINNWETVAESGLSLYSLTIFDVKS
jgi:hypothetical protein